MKTHLTEKTTNGKLGDNFSVSTTSGKACPTICPFNRPEMGDAPCYAMHGPLRMHWRKVTSDERGDEWSEFADKLRALPEGRNFRHNQAGDLIPDSRGNIDVTKLAELTEASAHLRAFTYTHHDVIDNYRNRLAIKAANASGFIINLSGNSLAHADQLKKADCGPVVSVVPGEWGRKHKGDKWLETIREWKERIAKLGAPKASPDGHRLQYCPATVSDASCSDCMACEKQGRDSIILFPAHGSGAKGATRISKGE